MSDASPSSDTLISRPLRLEEQELVRALLAQVSGFTDQVVRLAHSQVVDLPDGGMGSVRFMSPGPQAFGKELVSADYIDSDGTPVLISLNTDTVGNLFEIDLWKVDFSQLLRYPSPADVKVTSIAA